MKHLASFAIGGANGQAVLSVSGELEMGNAAQFRFAVADAMSRARSRFVLSLADVRYLDSSALSTIAKVARDTATQNADFRVILPRGHARPVFDVTHLNTYLNCYETVEDALA